MSDRVAVNVANMPCRKMLQNFDNSGHYVASGGVNAIGIDAPSNFGVNGTSAGRTDRSQDKAIAMGQAGNDNKVGIATDTAVTVELWTWCANLGTAPGVWILGGPGTTVNQLVLQAGSWGAFDLAEGTLYYLRTVAGGSIVNAALGGMNVKGGINYDVAPIV